MKKFKYTVITTSITIGSIVTYAIQSIVGFIAVYFFKPVWENFIEWCKNERKIN